MLLGRIAVAIIIAALCVWWFAVDANGKLGPAIWTIGAAFFSTYSTVTIIYFLMKVGLL